MDKAVRNFCEFTGASLAAGAQLAARNPATLMGLEPHWGSLEVGREANLVALSLEGHIQQCFRSGRPLLG
jgi:N-acetylglucosamine-6-phosphate deacetylase